MAGSRPRILSHYRLVKELGRGAMGVVFEGVDRRDDSRVAVKTLHTHLTKERSFRERFEREAHIGVLLRSPYTVQLLDYGVQAGEYFIVMEFVEGRPLSALLEEGPLPPDRAVRIGIQVARALQEAEARGIIHRDIKPDNIMVGQDDAVKVTDFGIARQTMGGTLTMAGAFIGTLAYAAPEQFMGLAGHRTDIWAVGATLYHILSGRPPFTGTLQEISVAVREQELDARPLAAVPPDVVRVVERCLKKKPEERFQSATELAAALETAAQRFMEPAMRESIGLAEAAFTPGATPVEQAATVVDVRGGATVPAVAGFVGPGSYSVVVRNPTEEPATVELRAEDTAKALDFEMPDKVALGPGESKIVQVRATSRPGQTVASGHQFTILATTVVDAPAAARGPAGPAPAAQAPPGEAAGGGPPAPPSARGRGGWLEGRPWPVIGGVAAGVAAVLVAGAYLLFGTGDGGGRPPTASFQPAQLPDLVLAPEDLGGTLDGFRQDFSGSLTPEILELTACPAAEGSLTGSGAEHYRVLYAPMAATPAPALESSPGGAATAPAGQTARSTVFAAAVELSVYEDSSAAESTVTALDSDLIANPRIIPCSRFRPEGAPASFDVEVGEKARGVEVSLTSASVAAGPPAQQPERERRLTAVRGYRMNLTFTVIVGDISGASQREMAMVLAGRVDEAAEQLIEEIESGATRTPAPPATATPAPSPAAAGTPAPAPPASPVPVVTQPAVTQPAVTAPPVTQPPVTQPPVTPSGAPPPASIVAGAWEYLFYVTYNDCDFGPAAGETVPWTIIFAETFPNDGYITAGETVSVYELDYSHYVGDFVFSYPVFEYEAPIQDGGFVRSYNEFYDASSGYGAREEDFGYCLVLFEE
jgi:serine/threonine-protein kinase